MSEKKAAWFRVPASAAGAEVKAPGLRTEQMTFVANPCNATTNVPHGTMKGQTMKAYQIITAGHIAAVLLALDVSDAIAKAAAAGIPATNAIRIDY